jgi:lactate dehydrogenase-like 2-hydroxyacid dehydrogenase
MKIDFTETEPPERDFFDAALAEHDLRFRTEVREVEADAEILCIYITSRIDAAFLDLYPELKLITTRSAGHDHIDVRECSRRDGGAGLDVLEEESVMRKDAGKIVTDQIIKHLQNAASREEAGMRTREGIKQIDTLFRNERLLSRPNVVFTPHVAFNSVEAVERMLMMTVENIRAFLTGKPINVVT